MYIQEFTNYLANEKRYSNHTLRSYLSDIEQFVEFGSSLTKNFNPLASDHIIIRKWIVFMLENGINAKSVRRKVSTLKTYYRFLQREQYIVNSPTDKVIVPKIGKQLPNFVGQKKMDLLFDTTVFPDTFEGIRDYTILLTFYGTGIRLSELIGICLCDVDFYNSQIKVKGKRNKERIIPFNRELSAKLNQYIEARKQIITNYDNLFITKKGNKLYQSLLYNMVKHYLGSVTSQKKRSPHIIRHSFATQLLNNGADIYAIKELLGHSSLSATQVYTHTSFEKLKKSYNQAHPRA